MSSSDYTPPPAAAAPNKWWSDKMSGPPEEVTSTSCASASRMHNMEPPTTVPSSAMPFLMPNKTPLARKTRGGGAAAAAKIVTLSKGTIFSPNEAAAAHVADKTPGTPGKASTPMNLNLFYSPVKNKTELTERSSKSKKRDAASEEGLEDPINNDDDMMMRQQGATFSMGTSPAKKKQRQQAANLRTSQTTKNKNGGGTTWHIKIGGSTPLKTKGGTPDLLEFTRDDVAGMPSKPGHDFWMCADCATAVTPLTEPCGKCKRGVDSLVPFQFGNSFAKAPTPLGMAAAAIKKEEEEKSNGDDWQQLDQLAMAVAPPARPFNVKPKKKEGRKSPPKKSPKKSPKKKSPLKDTAWKGVRVSEDGSETTMTLYSKCDEKRCNPVHNIVRKDIWEGFVVDPSMAGADDDQKRSGQRFAGTVGFRCRYCKSVPTSKRAMKFAVYPRSLERIYLANIRFQREHIE